MRNFKDTIDTEIQTDVLVIGGGLAGCFAAIAARKKGAHVIVIEKADIRRSGDATFGIDHVDLLHDDQRISPESPKQAAQAIRQGVFVDDRLPHEDFARETYERVLDLEGMGCKVRRPDGDFIRVLGPNKSIIMMMSADQKINLAREVKRLGIKIFNRTMMTNLITHKGAISGATCLNIRTGKFNLFRAKTVVLTTGKATRLGLDPYALLSGFFTLSASPANSGDGHAAAFRAGARLINMEIAHYNSMRYPLYLSGRGTIGNSRPEGFKNPVIDSHGNPIGGDFVGSGYGEMWKALSEGRGPIYYDMTSWPEYSQKLMTLGNACERPITLRYLVESGVDLRTHMIEAAASLGFRSLKLGISGIKIDGKCKTLVDGLYAAGDNAGGTNYGILKGAITLGYRAGSFAAEYAAQAELLPVDKDDLASEKAMVFSPLQSKGAISWQELERTIQLLVNEYVGISRSEWNLVRGLEHIDELKEKLVPQLKANNYHELMRCLEVKNIIDVAEMHTRSALTRRETRPSMNLYRIDYPITDNEQWGNTVVVITKEDSKMKISLLPPNQV